MNIKITISSIILVIFLSIRLLSNSFLLFIISIYDQFYFYDLITVFAILMQLISIIGILLKEKWGLLLSLGNGVYGIIINLSFPTSTMIGGIIVNIIQIGLSFLTYFFLNADAGLIIQKMQTQQQSTNYKIHASSILEPHVFNYCPNCGSKIAGNFCQSCGLKIN